MSLGETKHLFVPEPWHSTGRPGSFDQLAASAIGLHPTSTRNAFNLITWRIPRPPAPRVCDLLHRRHGISRCTSAADALIPLEMVRNFQSYGAVADRKGSTRMAATATRTPARGNAGAASDLHLTVLQRHPIFGEIGADRVRQLCAFATQRKVSAGDTIFAKGDPGSALFAVRKGSVKISVPAIDGREAVFNVLHEGEIFGEIALLDGLPRTADGVAITQQEISRIVGISRESVNKLLRKWEKHGLVQLERGAVVVRDPAKIAT